MTEILFNDDYDGFNDNIQIVTWTAFAILAMFFILKPRTVSDLRTECTCNGDANHGNEWAIGD